MKIAILVVVSLFALAESREIQKRAIMEIEDRSVWDQMNALARLPGDIMRNDFIALGLDIIIVSRFLPLPWIIATILNIVYKLLKFVHPAYWWLFPSTKPPNVEGYGFSKLY